MDVEHTEDGGAGGGDAFHGRPGGVNGGIADESQGGRGGNGERAMGALDGAAADVEGRSDPAVHGEEFGSGGGANNVDDGVDGADFMEVDALDGHGVNGGFSFAQELKGAGGTLLYRI